MAIFSTQEIANIIAMELNQIAKDLKTDEEILTEFVFYGTSDLSTYERIQTGEYEIDQYEKITPFILRSTNFAQSPEDYTRYEESFELKVYGFINEKTDLEKVFNVYTNSENTSNRVVSIDIFRIEKAVSKLWIDPEILQAQDGTLENRFEGTLGFVWSIAEGIVTSDDITISIDGVQIPYNVITLTTEKRNINSEPLTVTGINKFMATASGYAMSLNLPYLTTNTKLVELFQDVWNKKYNKKYSLSITIGSQISFVEDVFMSTGYFDDPKPTILNFAVTFKRVPKQTQIYINDTLVPVLEFSIVNEGQLSPTVKINEDSNKSAYLSSNFSIDMTLPMDENDSNSIISNLLGNILDGTFGVSYTVTISRNIFNKTYNVILNRGSYSFDMDSNSSIDVTFTEEDVD